MELVNPGLGLIFWMSLSFALVLWLLARFAWKPILGALKDREKSIDDALHAADKAREEMKMLQVDNEKLLREAKEERDAILRKARDIKESIIEEAREKASEEANRIIEGAKETINFEKLAAITELKNQVAMLSIEIAEKLLEKELHNKEEQKELINKMIDKIGIN